MKTYSLLRLGTMMLGISALAVPVYGQSDQEKVKEVIIQLFDAMRQADSVAVIQAFAPNAMMQTIAKTKLQTDTIRGNTVVQFAGSIARQKKGVLDERISFAQINMDANLAQVWTPYQFYLNGAFSHCGVNAFHLVKLNGHWKIQYIIDTRRKEGCL